MKADHPTRLLPEEDRAGLTRQNISRKVAGEARLGLV